MNHTYDDEYKKLPSFKKRATVSKSNSGKKANIVMEMVISILTLHSRAHAVHARLRKILIT